MSDARPAARAVAVVIALAAVGVGAPSCASVLDVEASEYHEVLRELCRCNVGGFDADHQTECFDRLRARFTARGTAAYADLLSAYRDHGCAECDNAAACFYRAPACSDGDCLRTEECCGAKDKSRICKGATADAPGTCSTCTMVGSTCKTDDECCAGTGHGKCLGVGASKFCVEECEPSDPTNCPGCCQHVEGLLAGKRQSIDLCADATPGFACRPTCTGTSDKASCSPGQSCVGVPLALSDGQFTVYGCQ